MSTDIGSLLQSLGMSLTLDDGELVESALLLVKVVDDEGDVCLRGTWTDGMDWITRRGIVEAARDNEVIVFGDREGDA